MIALSWPRWVTLVAPLGVLLSLTVRGQPPANVPSAVLPAEETDVATLPPAGPHRVFVMSGDRTNATNVVDADSDTLTVLGMVPISGSGTMALSGDASRIYVIETFYSHGNRGIREDVLTVYDGQTLNLLREIPLPGRLIVNPLAQVFDVSENNELAYVYDMFPVSAVHVINLEQGSLVTSVDLPGCALVFPYGARSFGTICGDGTVGAVQVPSAGTARAIFSKPFFDANKDPLFEGSVIDKSSGEAWFLSFSGKIFPVQLYDKPVVGTVWSVSIAAGLPPVGTGAQELAWRPGGGQVMALHRSSKRLFVLMHPGNYWTQKQAGAEVWVLDAVRRTLIRRIKLEAPAHSIAVSQDSNPLLYAIGDEGGFAVHNATTGERLRKRKLSGTLAWVPGT
jgi:methylamine dehydrogenase heavy chain